KIEASLYKIFKDYYDSYDIDKKIEILEQVLAEDLAPDPFYDDWKYSVYKQLQFQYIVKDINAFFEERLPSKLKEIDEAKKDKVRYSILTQEFKELEKEWEEKLLIIVKNRFYFWH